ncbi:MAG: polyprenyl synthetase family protein [Bacteroidia bacterium]
MDRLQQYRSGLENCHPKELYDPENYILGLGGKRLRPLLALIACDLYNKPAEKALESALCVEMFHNFSLVHDDILDAAPLRRNQATVHSKWNTNIAILSGDVMLVKAFQLLEKYPGEEFKQLASLFTTTAIQVCEGQQMDMNFENQNEVNVNDYITMITYKTAVLLGCSLKMGAINAGCNEKEQDNIYEFGKHLGIAFQLLDDVLDAYAGSADFGKQLGGDILSNKKTYLLIKTFELANVAQAAELKMLLLLDRSKSEEKISGVKKIFDELDIKNLSLKKATEHTHIAIKHLDDLGADKIKKEQLKDFARQLLSRNT